METASREECHVKMEEGIRMMEQKPGDTQDRQQTTRSRGGAGTGSHSPQEEEPHITPYPHLGLFKIIQPAVFCDDNQSTATAKPMALMAQGGFYETGGRVGMR